MKSLFAVLMLVTCATAQANAGAQPAVAKDPAWVKDMQPTHCNQGDCYNYATGKSFFDFELQDGDHVLFDPKKYPPEKLEKMQTEVVEWVKKNGIQVP
ncbi:hypothetical protein D3C86_1190340 [compost metagenome]